MRYTALVDKPFSGGASAAATTNQLSTTLGDEVVISDMGPHLGQRELALR